MDQPSRFELVVGWIEYRVFRVRWAIKSRWLRLRGRTGAFAVGEDSERAQQLTAVWEAQWPDDEPIGYMLRSSDYDRWVRFHSLPKSKRYAENEAEYRAIVLRHRTVLADLVGSRVVEHLVIIGEDFGPKDLATGRTRKHLPRAWPWRRYFDSNDTEQWSYYWVASGLSDAEFDDLLIAVADDQARVIIGAREWSWVYHPYDGGADVIAPSRVERDALHERYAEWLSDHPDGL